VSRILEDHLCGAFASNALDHRLFLLVGKLVPIAAAGFSPSTDVVAHLLLTGAETALIALVATDGY
jgi:hypothetical protein